MHIRVRLLIHEEQVEQADRDLEADAIKNTANDDGVMYSFRGYAEDGVRYIEAKFDPTFDETGNTPTDASKLMGGNRHGTSSEQRVTLDLADDYYQIASESRYNYSKPEEGKSTAPHERVTQWHYFINDIYFAEYGSEELTPYRVTINVKERADGEYVYSFSAEKKEESTSPRTLHAVVNSDEDIVAKGELSNERVPQSTPDVKYSDQDSDGNQLSKEQQEFFKDPKVRDAQGNLMVMYHGTANGGEFTVFDGDKLGNESRTTQIGQGFYFTNMKKEAESYTKNVDIFGRISKGSNPHLHQVYLNITNPFNVATDSLDMSRVKSVYMDGTYDYFFSNWIPFYMNNKTMGGRTFTKAEVQDMSRADKVSLYVDYLAQLGTKEILSNMVRAYPYGKQSELLASTRNRLGYDGIVEEFKSGQYQYVAFSSEQVKLTSNQKPTSDPDIRYSDRDYVAYDNTAIPKEETVDKYLSAYASKHSPKYAQAYIAYMSPDRFLDLTTSRTFRHQIEGDSYALDEEKFAKATNDQPLFLDIDTKTGKVTGHEGRHRCVALRDADINLVPVLLFDMSTKNSKVDVPEMQLTGQFDKYASSSVENMIPLSYENRDRIIKEFASQSSMQKMKEKYGHGKTLRYQDRPTDSVSNRSLLANALEEVTQNDIERKRLQEYKDKIDYLNEQEKTLVELNEEIKHDFRDTFLNDNSMYIV